MILADSKNNFHTAISAVRTHQSQYLKKIQPIATQAIQDQISAT